jgi:hypothetical protein
VNGVTSLQRSLNGEALNIAGFDKHPNTRPGTDAPHAAEPTNRCTRTLEDSRRVSGSVGIIMNAWRLLGPW